MTSLLPLFINGKFLAQRMTGVQRFALACVQGLDEDLRDRPVAQQPVLLLPPGVPCLPDLRAISQVRCGSASIPLTAWEQTVLPFHARKGLLLCLSGSAPLLVRSCIPTIHDAAVYLHPQAYSRTFVTWYRLLFSWHARRAPALLTVSEKSRQELAHFLPTGRWHVVPNAVDFMGGVAASPRIITELGLKPRGFVLAVGSLNPTKNFAALIEGYKRSPLASRLLLVVVGGASRRVHRDDAAAPRATGSVLFAGAVTDSELRALYEQAAVFVFPSLYEGFGIPPLEAMQYGCPVAASSASAIPEVCGDAALYFDPRDKQAMVAAITRLIDDPVLQADLVARGHVRSARFTRRNTAQRLRAALEAAGALPLAPPSTHP